MLPQQVYAITNAAPAGECYDKYCPSYMLLQMQPQRVYAMINANVIALKPFAGICNGDLNGRAAGIICIYMLQMKHLLSGKLCYLSHDEYR